MNKSELLHLSLEQIVEEMGDPVPALFEVMYERFPLLQNYKDDPDWENYMFAEILENFLQYVDDPDTARVTLKDMKAHHELIGVPVEVFTGMYQALYDVMTPVLSGPQKEEMVEAWQANVDGIRNYIEQCPS